VESVKLHVPKQYQQQCLKLLLQNHEAVSQDKFNLGRTDTLMHEIALKTEEPIYIKQFRIPDAHQKEVERHVLKWLKLGVIQPARSRYNSPIFAVIKKDGTIRLVQDFRALNNESYTDKYIMKDVSKCIGEIGRPVSTIFSTIDLTAGFWQMILHLRARPYTAFTVPSMGQFQWVTSPMSLLGCPASFQRLMETVVNGISNVIVYINDLLLHSATHEEHLATLGKVLKHLIQHKIKINLQKCIFGSKEVSYLGFRLTEEGIKPGTDKLKALKNAPTPSSVHEVRQFLGLCNFLRGHVCNFAQLTSPLTTLTKKDCSWKGGQLSPDALPRPTSAQKQLSTTPDETGPTHSSLTPSSVMKKSQGALAPFLCKFTQMVSIVSLHMQAESCKSMNAITRLYCLKCKLLFEAWTIWAPNYEAENSHSLRTTDL